MRVARTLTARPHCRTSRASDRVFAAASAKPSAGPIKVVGFGGCGVDYLASVAAYPKPDDKLRTEKLEVQGGGNCGNAITAMARLGLAATIVTKIGGDGLGDGIISELQGDGVSTQHILRAEGHPSPFTYIIVDRSGGTRTCIHTPGADFGPQELSEAMLDAIVEGAALIYFDGRLTEAALKLAAYAKAKGVQLLVEAERLRPNLDRLLQLADYVVTSAHFPQDWTGESTIEDAVLSTALRLPAARMLLTTMGTRGAVLLERAAATEAPSTAAPVPIASVVHDLRDRAEAARPPAGAQPDCVSASGVAIQRGGVAETSGPVALTYSSARNASTAAAQVQAASTRAAALNADADNSTRYSMGGSTTATLEAAAASMPVLRAKVTFATIASLPKEKVVDTTGAGDSFIGATVYGIVSGLGGARTMQLAAVVAACKCTALGARPGLPRASSLEPSLL